MIQKVGLFKLNDYLLSINMNTIMSRFDGTGPMGQGPRTGRGMGPCGGGQGFGGGFGQGFGGRRFWTKKEETEILKEEIENLEDEIKAMKEHLNELKG